MTEVALKLDSYSSKSEKEIQKKTVYLPNILLRKMISQSSITKKKT